jgi:hypothetical protein
MVWLPSSISQTTLYREIGCFKKLTLFTFNLKLVRYLDIFSELHVAINIRWKRKMLYTLELHMEKTEGETWQFSLYYAWISSYSSFLSPKLHHKIIKLQEEYSAACARIYRSSFGHENDRFRENKAKTLVFNPIRTQRRRFPLVLDEIRLVGSFQILELRRGWDQHVFMPKEQPY